MLADATQLGRIADRLEVTFCSQAPMKTPQPPALTFRGTPFARGASLALALALAGCAIKVEPMRDSPPLAQASIAKPAVIAEVHSFLREKTAFDAFVAVSGEREVTRWGEADLPINTHSVRKSIMSALVGIAIYKQFVIVSRNDTGRDAVRVLWAVAFGKDGFRDHHQKLHQLTIEALSGAPRWAAPA
jgi:hypothetical protein